MIDVLQLIEEAEARSRAESQPEVDVLALIEAVGRSGPTKPISKQLIKEVIGDAAALPVCAINNDEDPCRAGKPKGSRQSWSAVGIYCWQASEGPPLTISRGVSRESLPLDWIEQQIRSISESVLDRFHHRAVKAYKTERDGSSLPEPLPLQEARRLVKILEDRIERRDTTERERAFVAAAIRRGQQYIDAWQSLIKPVNAKILE